MFDYLRVLIDWFAVRSGVGSYERGATMIEYALMVALIAVVCIVAVTAIGTDVKATFWDVAGKLS